MPKASEAPDLISISVRSLENHPDFPVHFPRPQQAVIVATSSKPAYSFRFETGGLVGDTVKRCLELQRHGSTVIEFSDEEHLFYHNRLLWQDSMIKKAMKRIAMIYEEVGDADTSAYDPELANTVLVTCQSAFPKELTVGELKHGLQPEPSDAALLTALKALLIDKLIEGSMLYSGDLIELKQVGSLY